MNIIDYNQLQYESANALWSGDYMFKKRDSKKYFLLNISSLPSLTLRSVISRWECTSHIEWEALLANWFLSAIANSQRKHLVYADITDIFSHDLSASRGLFWGQIEIYQHLISFFDIVQETDSTVLLVLKKDF